MLQGLSSILQGLRWGLVVQGLASPSWHLPVSVPALNAPLGVPLSCCDPFDAPGATGASCPAPDGAAGARGKLGTSTGSQPSCVTRKRRKEKEKKWKEKEKNLLLLNLKASRAHSLCGASRPCGLTREPAAHEQIVIIPFISWGKGGFSPSPGWPLGQGGCGYQMFVV